MAGNKNILILGTGALGAFFAGYLSRCDQNEIASDHSVIVHGSWVDQIEKIQSSGLVIREYDGSETLRHFHITESIHEIPPADIIIVLVKGYQTDSKLEIISEKLKPDGMCLTLQNGLGNSDIISQRIGESRTVTGITLVGVRVIKPGIIEHTGPGETYIEAHANVSLHIDYLATLLNSCGIETVVTSDIDAKVWTKLAINAALNPLTALMEIPNGGLLKDERLKKIVHMIITETVAVSNENGVNLDSSDTYALMLDVCRRTARNHSSMFQDMSRGARTEIHSINGSIVQMGAAKGIDVPMNRLMLEMIERKEANGGKPSEFLKTIEQKFHLTV